jgi:tRNA pseudouridine38-40 synthase
MFRYFIYLAYDGTNYHGWQIQPNGSSVQETLMKALHTFLRDEAIEVVGAGRTDAGVHARLMVAHFDVEWMLDETTTRMLDSLVIKIPWRVLALFPFLNISVCF